MTKLDENGEPSNEQRAEWAQIALDAFLEETEDGHNTDAVEENITNLIADLIHLAHWNGLDARKVAVDALHHFNEEVRK